MELEPIFILAIVFGFTYAVILLFVRKKERMALIEQGKDAPLMERPRPNILALKFGLLFIGVAIGLLLGSLLVELTTLNDEAAYFSMVFLFGGIGLVVSHFLERKEIQEFEKKLKG